MGPLTTCRQPGPFDKLGTGSFRGHSSAWVQPPGGCRNKSGMTVTEGMAAARASTYPKLLFVGDPGALVSPAFCQLRCRSA